ncbi:hypothetical protein J3458_019066 [Metarhizium acridum]|uniref:Uncharacterized protein n=1 Tax=Metarhizium acridum (strain CQMa 102) TaxID=655827 RepID=E9DWM3_METAQ|nr:uncharacterized protein MAC_02021 [Metarhizium acridum CQMa 102]EFY92073.1 hypothetical protein MAC_02021 [Metarhizium acridum CQMa 102]KAG8409995.1 hypothetical protein J3458_019066 [Metarhizium acridum]
MLTVKQPPAYGYRSVHDLPTPPSTSRPSPPLSHSEAAYKHHQVVSRSHSPSSQAMSAPHRGLPPPAAMALPPQQAPPSAAVPPQHHGHQQPPPPPPPTGQGGPQAQPWTSLPPPPQQWHGSEESMRTWLQAKTEEEKTKQEEEKTRQEGLRLEQRRVEMDMLRDSLRGGIPPPMIPLVFAGMAAGGTLPQTAVEWAQQFLSPVQSQPLQLLPPQRQHSPDPHQREGASQGQYPGPGANPAAPPPGPGAYGPYPGSPTRPRGQTVSGVVGRSGISVGGIPSQPSQPGGAGVSPYGSQTHMHTQPAPQESSPGLYFHHWQPPATQSGSGSSNRPGTPSGASKTKRKRDSL